MGEGGAEPDAGAEAEVVGEGGAESDAGTEAEAGSDGAADADGVGGLDADSVTGTVGDACAVAEPVGGVGRGEADAQAESDGLPVARDERDGLADTLGDVDGDGGDDGVTAAAAERNKASESARDALQMDVVCAAAVVRRSASRRARVIAAR